MAFTFDPLFATDPNNAANVAANASIIIFDPADAGKAPITITDVTGAALPNPITVNKNGFGPAFVADLDRVGWFGAGFTGYFTSYEGMKLVATDAQTAAEAAQAAAEAAAATASAPADVAISEAITTPGTATATALNTTILDAIETPIADAVAPYAERSVLSFSAFSGGKKVAMCGDSITDGAGSTNTTVDSYRAFLGKMIGGARATLIDHGVPGENAAGLLARMDAIIAANPDAAHVMIGTNTSSTFAAFKADYAAIIGKLRDAGIPTVLSLLPPRGASVPGEVERTNLYNMWIRDFAARNGLTTIDTFGALVDPTTGTMLTAYDSDGTHPNPAGHLKLAETIRPALSAILPDQPNPVKAPGAPGLVANPLMAAVTPALPTGWSDYGVTAGTRTNGTVAPTTGSLLTAGQFLFMRLDCSATGAGNTTRRYNFAAPVASGDTLLVSFIVETENPTADYTPGKGVTVALGMNNADRAVVGDFGTTRPGRQEFITTANGAYTPYIRLTVGAGAAGINEGRIGQLQVWNLTTGALLELAA